MSVRRITHQGCAALREGAALVEHPGAAVLRLSGRDPAGLLEAILTNTLPKEESRGVYALLLNPKGRIQADLRVVRQPGEVLVVTGPESAEAVRAILGRYAPFSRVSVEETDLGVLGLYGPRAAELAGLEGRPPEHLSVRLDGLLAVGVELPVPGVDLIGEPAALRSARESLAAAGAVAATGEEYETARIAAGVPRFGKDFTPENFPAEAGLLERAVSFEKGCYPGQETVARMYYRGHPNKTLHRFVLEPGASPPPGSEILQNGRRAGVLTSIAPLPSGDGAVFALGYLRRGTDPEGPLSAGGVSLKVAQGRTGR
ncbi:MAG: folate-binding protein YgfZ [Rubrobacter sp.]|nr:folate-binding protein YgfZ [Rubrobacter sp.]